MQPTQPNSEVTASQVLDAAESSPASPSLPAASIPKEPTPEAPEKKEKFSSKFSVVVQRERAAIEREKKLKEREQEFESRFSRFSEMEKRMAQFEELRKTNPIKAAEMVGLSYQELTQAQLNDGNVTPEMQIKQLRDELANKDRTLEAEKRAQAEEAEKRQKRELEKTTEKFKTEIASFIKDKANRYEFIEFEQAHDLVYETIEENYQRTLKLAQAKATESGEDPSDAVGEIMTTAQAADKVEAYLEKKYQKAVGLSKTKALLSPRQAAPTVEKPKTPQSQTPKTLNNQLSATPAARRSTAISDEERISRAIAFARGLRPGAI